ncbi:valine--tRNA ligase [bacterium]|nr:valine--tRNA ligase [bacterium]MCP5462704.1 valine--tRNA ligase [bacterium]
MMDIPKQYSPQEIENKWSEYWEKGRFFHADPSKKGTPYTIVIPPPNVTAALHMGHALNNTVQDILVRWRRMQGYNTFWVTGTDHAGIATQNVVERKLRLENTTRHEIGREDFVKRVWKWREEYGGKIINQLKRLGCSCDWERERFTLDEGLSNAVQEVFVRLYEKGLIYQNNFIINWCPRCLTALSDEEVEHREIEGALYHIAYKIKKSDAFIVVATTRPETLLGDTAIALNPKDPRYEQLKDKTIILPVIGREIPVIGDDFVDPSFGTGIVKVTPAHDPNDFEMGRRHNLPSVNVMHEDGTMNENAGHYNGMYRFDCRKKLVEELKQSGQIIKIERHIHAVGHCYRCDTIVEPRLSLQWFVNMKPLAKPAIDAVKDGKIKIYPERWVKVYLDWMENIRDWCISRQIWWGHRIPVWKCTECGKIFVGKSIDDIPAGCDRKNIVQDEDVLDTWFSSWLWPFSTLGWPQKTEELAFYYPTDTLVTAPEILFFWVARMIMAGLEFMGDVPFRDVYLHGTVRDDTGTKMSKSLGNTIDPLDVIEEFGTDALRFSMILITAEGQDVYLSPKKFEIGRNFANKIWNASRFLLMNFGEETTAFKAFDRSLFSTDDWYIVGTLHECIKHVTDSLGKFRINEAAQTIYDFFWHCYCDRYIEAVKTVLYGDDEKLKANTRKILFYVLDNTLRILHPLMPFITEELWHRLHQICPDDSQIESFKTIALALWPEYDATLVDHEMIQLVEHKYELISAARNLRSEYDIPATNTIRFVLKPENGFMDKFSETEREIIKKMMRAESLAIKPDYFPESALPSAVVKAGTLYMPLEGVFDKNKEIERLTDKLSKLKSSLNSIERKLSNKDFVDKAPSEVVEKERIKAKELSEQVQKIQNNLQFIQQISS